MDANEMKYEFNVLYDKITSLSAPGYTDREVGVFLSKAEEIFVEKAYTPYKGFEQNEQRRKDFDELKSYVSITTPSAIQTGVHSNGTMFDLPLNYLYTLQEEAKITSTNTCVNDTIIEIVPVTEDEYNRTSKDPFKKPTESRAWRMEVARVTPGDAESKRHEVITNGSYTIAEYNVRYIRRPGGIVPFTGDGSTPAQINSILDQSTHRDLIDIAVRIATATTNPEEYQVKTVEENINSN